MKTYHIITLGCQMNKSDSEKIAFYLEDLGLIESTDKLKADLVIFTTCGIRQSAEDRVYGMVPAIKKKNPTTKIILTGCLSGRPDVQRRLKKHVDVWLPITELSGLAEKLGMDDSSLLYDDYLKINSKYSSNFSAFIPIGNGCDKFCTYCVVPYARGRENYREAEDIWNEVEGLVKQGYKEIVLVAQNVNSYKSKNKNKDKEVNFAQLIKGVNDIEGDFWIRFLTSHPQDMSDELIQVAAEGKKICEYIHLPAQSGNNEILSRMNRNYTIEHYLGLVDKIKKAIPKVSLTTDIIVGFPGETVDQFNETKELFEKVEYDMAYIGQYSPRPGTPAAKLEDDVTREEKKRLKDLLSNIFSQKKWLNY